MDTIAQLISSLSPKKRAQLAEQLGLAAQPTAHPREPIAIIGLSCRFPGADGREAYWKLLKKGKISIREIPTERWDANDFYDPDSSALGKMISRWGGFLDKVDHFDAGFFRIS